MQRFASAALPRLLLRAAQPRLAVPAAYAAVARSTAPAVFVRFGGGGAMPTEDQVTERVINILKNFAKITDQNKLTPDAHLIKDLGLDSLDVVECVVVLEDEFVVRFPDQEAERIFTPRDAAKTILKAMSKNYAQ